MPRICQDLTREDVVDVREQGTGEAHTREIGQTDHEVDVSGGEEGREPVRVLGDRERGNPELMKEREDLARHDGGSLVLVGRVGGRERASDRPRMSTEPSKLLDRLIVQQRKKASTREPSGGRREHRALTSAEPMPESIVNWAKSFR